MGPESEALKSTTVEQGSRRTAPNRWEIRPDFVRPPDARTAHDREDRARAAAVGLELARGTRPSLRWGRSEGHRSRRQGGSAIEATPADEAPPSGAFEPMLDLMPRVTVGSVSSLRWISSSKSRCGCPMVWRTRSRRRVGPSTGGPCPEFGGCRVDFGPTIVSGGRGNPVPSGRGDPGRWWPGAEARARPSDDRGRLPAAVAAEGPDGGRRADRHTGPPGDGLCRVGRVAANHRLVHLHSLPGRVRRPGFVPDPGARSRLLARSDDRRHDPPLAGADGTRSVRSP